MGTLKARVGGAWVDIAGTSDEVFVGPDDPIATIPTSELWYDTDASAIVPDGVRWHTAWGVIGEGTFTGTQAGITGTVTDVTNLTVTFTPVVGRRYLYRVKADVLTTVAGDVPVMTITDAAGTALDRFTTHLSSTSSETWAWAVAGETFATATPVTRKVRLVRAIGTGSLSVYAAGGNPAKLIVEDVGPVGGSYPAATQGGSWIPLPFATGWSSYAGFVPCSYRKVGDVVSLRGLLNAGSGVTTTIATLPVGFRPTAQELFATQSSASGYSSVVNRVDVFPSGLIMYQGAPAAGLWLTLSCIQFSVSA